MHGLTARTLRQCSVEHLEKMKGSNFSDNNSNEISEHIERPLMWTSCREVLYLVKLKEINVLSLLELQQPRQKKYFSAIDFTIEIRFSKMVCAHRKTSHTHPACRVIYTARHLKENPDMYCCSSITVFKKLRHLPFFLEKPVDELKYFVIVELLMLYKSTQEKCKKK